MEKKNRFIFPTLFFFRYLVTLKDYVVLLMNTYTKLIGDHWCIIISSLWRKTAWIGVDSIARRINTMRVTFCHMRSLVYVTTSAVFDCLHIKYVRKMFDIPYIVDTCNKNSIFKNLLKTDFE